MEAVSVPVTVRRTLAAEDAARADFYALLARFFVAAPDAALLANLAAADAIPADGDPALSRAWRDLVDASSAMDADAARDEFAALFEGVGKAEVSVYAGFYGGAPSIDHPRVRIQADLAALGLARPSTVTEPEDHYSGLFEAMRVLVAGGAARGAATVAEQKRFFQDHLQPGMGRFFTAVGRSPAANYYRHVAAVGAAFTALESESFQLD
ncbi:MAG TPA: molecular chaperone TorD family protein [Usitatibacter sp.]|nr:molecular chaperone TorD family protein [Usitatibacter sp.]